MMRYFRIASAALAAFAAAGAFTAFLIAFEEHDKPHDLDRSLMQLHRYDQLRAFTCIASAAALVCYAAALTVRHPKTKRRPED